MFTHICYVNTNIFPMKNCSFHFNNKSKHSLDPLSLPFYPSVSYTEAWQNIINAHSKCDSTALCLPWLLKLHTNGWNERFETRWAFHIFSENWKFSKKIEMLLQTILQNVTVNFLSHGDVFTNNFEVTCNRQLWQLIFTRNESIKIGTNTLYAYSKCGTICGKLIFWESARDCIHVEIAYRWNCK